MFDKFNKLVRELSVEHGVGHHDTTERLTLLHTAATLILAEEIHKLTTTASALATATANLAGTFTQLNQDFNTAWPIIQQALQGNPQGTPQADIDAAVASMNTLASNLQTLDADFKGVGQPVSTPPVTTPPAA